MELSRKEKFGTKKVKSAKKWPKVILVTVFALMLGTTSAFAANKTGLTDYLYNQIVKYTYKTDIQNQLKAEKDVLLTNLSEKIQSIFNQTKTELDTKKSEIIISEKEELKSHYESELAKITERKEDAIDKKTQEMTEEASEVSDTYKNEITKEIEKEVKKSNINK